MKEIEFEIQKSIEDSLCAIAGLKEHIDELERIIEVFVNALKKGRKLMFIGNGGSAADAQHAAAEFVGRLGLGSTRGPLPAVALSTDTSAITAIANDFGFDEVFSRQVQALAQPEDVLICISTSGSSRNIILAAESARARGCIIVSLTGPRESPLEQLSDYIIKINGNNTPRIQEAHCLALHILCEFTEKAF